MAADPPPELSKQELQDLPDWPTIMFDDSSLCGHDVMDDETAEASAVMTGR